MKPPANIFYADPQPGCRQRQGGTRPFSRSRTTPPRNTRNPSSPPPITSQTGKARLPTHISLAGHDVGLYKDSVVLLEQIRTIDKRRLREHMGHADESVMNQVDSAIAVSFGLTGI